MMVLTASYSGALISFFSVEVYPSPPQTFDDLAKVVQEDNLKVQVCCPHIRELMAESNMESFKIMTAPDKVSNKKQLIENNLIFLDRTKVKLKLFFDISGS